MGGGALYQGRLAGLCPVLWRVGGEFGWKIWRRELSYDKREVGGACSGVVVYI